MVRYSQQEILFLLGLYYLAHVISRGLMLPGRFDTLSLSFAVRDVTTELPGSWLASGIISALRRTWHTRHWSLPTDQLVVDIYNTSWVGSLNILPNISWPFAWSSSGSWLSLIITDREHSLLNKFIIELYNCMRGFVEVVEFS